MPVEYDENGTPDYSNAAPQPQPNNPDNPYFGLEPKTTDEFYGHIALSLGPVKYARIRKDDAFLWVKDLVSHLDTVDPDDVGGRFLLVLAYLTNDKTNPQLAALLQAWGQNDVLAADGQPLLSEADETAVMSGW